MPWRHGRDALLPLVVRTTIVVIEAMRNNDEDL
jgi:hypothetical protein